MNFCVQWIRRITNVYYQTFIIDFLWNIHCCSCFMFNLCICCSRDGMGWGQVCQAYNYYTVIYMVSMGINLLKKKLKFQWQLILAYFVQHSQSIRLQNFSVMVNLGFEKAMNTASITNGVMTSFNDVIQYMSPFPNAFSAFLIVYGPIPFILEHFL